MSFAPIARASTMLVSVVAVACAPPARHAVAQRPAHAVAPPRVAAPEAALDEDRPDNPYPEWITADWAETGRPTRATLVAYAKRANAWTAQCRKGFADLEHDAATIDANVEREIATIPQSGSPYDAFAAFRVVETHFTLARDRIQKARGLDGWEASFFLQPIEHRIQVALLEWEGRSSPLLVSAAGTTPLGVSMPVATTAAPGIDREALYCRHARDRGTRAAPAFFPPTDILSLVRRPFEATPTTTASGPAATRAPPSPAQSAYFVEGVVRSVSNAAPGTRVTFEHSWKMLEQRPPCHVERCKGIDCGMGPGGPMRRICREVTVSRRVRFVALFSSLPRGLELRPGDAVSFQAAEEFELTPPYRKLFHAVVLQWVDRPKGDPQRVFSLGPD